jgi:hypothetical protein
MISYLHLGLEPFKIAVRVEGKKRGFIRRDGVGYFYTAKRGHRGKSYPTVEACKASLESGAL